MQKHVNLVDLVKSFPTNIFLQNLASIQKGTSPIKFAHLADKSENGSTSNLLTKAPRASLMAVAATKIQAFQRGHVDRKAVEFLARLKTRGAEDARCSARLYAYFDNFGKIVIICQFLTKTH